jgi:two-component system NarL family response regulator
MRILLVDDHQLFLDGLKTLLTTRGIEVVGTARNGLEGLEKTRALQPEVVLMDLRMPQVDGLAATRLIKAELPDVKVVVLTMSEDDEDLFEAIRSGASGYLLKTEDTDRFLDLLAGLTRGEVPLSPGLADRILKELAQKRRKEEGALDQNTGKGEVLTTRQAQVLALVAGGLTYKEVGAKLFLSERTIKYHMGEIIERLHMESRREAIEFAKRMKMEFRSERR